MLDAVNLALLLLCVAALGDAAVRLVSRVCPTGLERVLAAAPVAVGAALCQALGLGLVGLGSNRAALVAATAGMWLASRALLPAPALPLRTEVSAWWTQCTVGRRLLAGALVGIGLATVAWCLRHPYVGGDGLKYHLPEAAQWVRGGHPGSVHEYIPLFPVGWYPVTNEVVLAWLFGLSGSLLPMALWSTGALTLVGAATWVGCRSVSAPKASAAAATVALVTLPAGVLQVNGPDNDLTAYAFFLCAAALVAASRRRPGLLAPAVLSLGISWGIKSIGLVLGLVVLLAALVVHRNRLRALAPPLVVAALVAIAVGGVWYLRDLVVHGSPFWPLVSTPWGDPASAAISTYGGKFAADPIGLLGDHYGDYLSALGGGTVLILAGLIAPVLRPGRRSWLLSGAILVSLLVWSNSPFTGLPSDPSLRNAGFVTIAANTTRYLLPAMAAGGLALVWLATRGGWAARVSTAVLSTTAVWNVVRLVLVGPPQVPRPSRLVLGAVAGLAAAGLLAVGASRLSRAVAATPSWAAVVVAGAAAGLALAPSAQGYWVRQAQLDLYGERGVVQWLARQPGFASGHEPVASTSFSFAPFAGDHLQHPLSFLPNGASCGQVEARARAGWLVLIADPLSVSPLARGCLQGVTPRYRDPTYTIFRLPGGKGVAERGAHVRMDGVG